MNKEKKYNPFHQLMGYKIRVLSLLLWDIAMIQIASGTALLLRFDFQFSNVDPYYWGVLLQTTIMQTTLTIIVFGVFYLYSSLWRFAGMVELANIVAASFCSSLLQFIGIRILDYSLPRSWFFIYPLVLILLISIGRFSYRMIRLKRSSSWNKGKKSAVRTLIIGAGSAGYMLINEIKTSQYLNYEVPCVIDDDPQKKGSIILGVPIVGGRDKIFEAVEKYKIEEIILAVPSMGPKDRKKLLDVCTTTGCKVKMVPGLYQLLNNEVSISEIREVEIEDLLGRAPVKINIDSICNYVKDQVVLVTGGGGSIGSEICRQIASKQPKQLIIVDNYENNAYSIQMELKREVPKLNLVVLIASVQCQERIRQIFQTYKPDLVFHAAAHKHVPLMEDSPGEAIKNNVLGTYHVAQEAHRNHVKKMVLISTDKAVRPTNVMGASKRICEMIIQAMNHLSETEYVAVRFGNVLGSNGSVIPLFREQIKAGGPVTVTHKDIIRYFMTIPEAVSLVLQAGVYAKGGEIFILDMGEPVKILDLAKNLIRLSGLTPGVDIDIQFIGLRPGEKLYEELLIDDKRKKETANSRIFIGNPPDFDEEKFWKQLSELREIVFSEEQTDLRRVIQQIVPEYHYKK